MPKYATEYTKDGTKFADTIVAVDEASAKLVCSGRNRGEVIVGVIDPDATIEANAPLEACSTEPEVLGDDEPVADAVAEISADEGVNDDDVDD